MNLSSTGGLAKLHDMIRGGVKVSNREGTMNDLVKTEVTDKYEAEALKGLQHYQNLRRERDVYKGNADHYFSVCEKLTAENESLVRRLADNEHKLGHYMRLAVELQTRLKAGAEMFINIIKEASHGAYRPNGHVPDLVANDEFHRQDNVPAFLKEPLPTEPVDNNHKD